MPPKKAKSKSVFRSDKAQHFQVVHRSQRDPLINDPDAGQHVLKAVNAPNSKAKTRQQLEQDERVLYGQDGNVLRRNVGEAALYGVYFDDTEYDYMQHLRPIRDNDNSRRGGVDELDDTEAILISAPKKASKAKGDGFALRDEDDDDEQRDRTGQPSTSSPSTSRAAATAASAQKHSLSLPASAFASKEERPFSYTSHLNVEPSLQGFQPDMDPHLRQALEALDDEAFVDGDLEDDFFTDVVKGGEWDGAVRGDDDDWRDLPPEGDESIWLDPGQRAAREVDEQGQDSLSLEARVALFKKAQEMERAMAAQAKGKGRDAGPDDEGAEHDSDEDHDQLRSLPPASKAGTAYTAGGSVLGKKGKPGAMARRAASTRAGSVGGGSTAWSMTSSSMSRNKGLSDLDDRFDKVGRLYGIREDFDPSLDNLSEFGTEDFEEDDEDEQEGGEDAPSREDFDHIMDEFLDEYEVIAGRLRENLGAKDATGAEKLELVRKALGAARIDGKEWEGKGRDVGKGTEESLGEYDDYESDEEEIAEMVPRSHMREKWDVETVLSTKTNLENHPRTISARESVMGVNRSALPKKIGQSTGPVAKSITSSYSQRPNAAAFLDDDERLPKIRVNPRTGFPEIIGYSKPRKNGSSSKKDGAAVNGIGHVDGAEDRREEEEEDQDDSDGGDTAGEEDGYDSDATEGGTGNVTVARDRQESREEKRARKAAVKAAKQERRTQKATTKKTFASERKKQARAESGRRAAEGGPNGMRLL